MTNQITIETLRDERFFGIKMAGAGEKQRWACGCDLHLMPGVLVKAAAKIEEWSK